MNNSFETVQIGSWREVFDLPEVKHGPSVFRGQSADQDLETSLERQFRRYSIRGEHFLHKEWALLREFQRRAHLYLQDVPTNEDLVGWMALMQHHGAPTRLLDFTYSFFVACYFAFMECSEKPVVWAVSDLWLRECLSPNELRHDLLGRQIDVANTQLKMLHEEFRGGGSPTRVLDMVLMIEPTHQIQRLAVQQGLFLMPLNLHNGFMKNLLSTPSHSDDADSDWISETSKHIKKLQFSKEVAREGLLELRKMNITAESLFPGIDGLAKSLNHTVLAV